MGLGLRQKQGFLQDVVHLTEGSTPCRHISVADTQNAFVLVTIPIFCHHLCIRVLEYETGVATSTKQALGIWL